MSDDHLRYPTGKFVPKSEYTSAELSSFISVLEALPSRLQETIRGFSETQFNTPYREGGWTARQVIHHLADSHMNAYIRFKWTLTESTPLIKAYDEKAWAETPEVSADPQISVHLIQSLHAKWVIPLRALTPHELQREYVHPETKKNIRLDRMMALYAWHSGHHIGHLKIVAGGQS